MKNSTLLDFLVPVMFFKPITNTLGLNESAVLQIHQRESKKYDNSYTMPDEVLMETLGISSLKQLRRYENKLMRLGILRCSKGIYSVDFEKLDAIVEEGAVCL